MTTSKIKDRIDSDVHKVWETVLAVDKYNQYSNMKGHWIGVFLLPETVERRFIL